MLFRHAFFSKQGSNIYTIQSSDKESASYLTLWNFHTQNQQIESKTSVKIHNAMISQANMSPDGLFIGVGSADGKIKIINTRTLQEDCQSAPHNMPVTGLSFAYYGKLLLSGSVDHTYSFLPNEPKSGMFRVAS